MAFELLGPSLEDLFNYCGRIFSLKTVLMLADQIISRVQCIHSKDLIHQDIKPDNFVMGRGKNGNCVYIIDLGLAAPFSRGGTAPVAQGLADGMLGTATFASLNGHRCHCRCTWRWFLIAKPANHSLAQSQRDDMESLGYMILYFLKGRLPWHTVKRKSKQQTYRQIMDRKISISLDELCSDTPEEIKKYMKYVRTLNFEDKPDYSRIRRMFRDLFVRRGFEYDYVFDWTVLKYKESLRTQSRKTALGSWAT